MSEETEFGGIVITPIMRIMGELFSHLVDLQDIQKDGNTPPEIAAKLVIANEFLRQAAVLAQQAVLAEAEQLPDD